MINTALHQIYRIVVRMNLILLLLYFFSAAEILCLAVAVTETCPNDASSSEEDPRCVKRENLKILFVHQNFPAQFKHLAPALVKEGHDVTAMGRRKVTEEHWQGVRMIKYPVKTGTTPEIRELSRSILSK